MVRTRVMFVVTVAVVGILTGTLAASVLQQPTAMVQRGGSAMPDPGGQTPVAPAVTLGLSPSSGFSSSSGAGTAAPAPTETPTAPPTDDTVTRVRVYENGSARWTIEIRTRLGTDGDVENFRAFQRRFRENTSEFLDPFAERMTGVVANAANATDREMTATDFAAETSIQEVPRRWGVVSFSFRWSAFAATDGDALVVGDVFQGGFFLAENDSLVVAGPEGYVVADATPRPTATESATVTWEGRRDFSDGRPRVRFEPTDPGADGTPADGSLWTPIGLALGGLLTMVAGAWLYRRRAGTTERADGGDPGGGATMGTGDPVRTDPERVEALVADNGGRMRQADVADALDWSASKTSRVLADMVEDDRVEKLRVGRENVVELRDEG